MLILLKEPFDPLERRDLDWGWDCWVGAGELPFYYDGGKKRGQVRIIIIIGHKNYIPNFCFLGCYLSPYLLF